MLLLPLLSSIKPIGHYAMLGCPARGPARPGQGSSINHMSQRKEAGKKKVKVNVCWARVWRRLQLPVDYADYNHRCRRRRVCYRFHSTICIAAVKVLLQTQTTI